VGVAIAAPPASVDTTAALSLLQLSIATPPSPAVARGEA